MPRSPGDTNYSAREKRLEAEAAVQKARAKELQETVKLMRQQIKDLTRRLKGK